jgi:hypothetical protein
MKKLLLSLLFALLSTLWAQTVVVPLNIDIIEAFKHESEEEKIYEQLKKDIDVALRTFIAKEKTCGRTTDTKTIKDVFMVIVVQEISKLEQSVLPPEYKSCGKDNNACHHSAVFYKQLKEIANSKMFYFYLITDLKMPKDEAKTWMMSMRSLVDAYYESKP